MTTSQSCIQCGKELPPPAKTGPRRKFCPVEECSRLHHNNKIAERKGRDPSEIKRRKSRATLARSEVCLHCGESLIGTRRHRFCSNEHAETWNNDQRKTGAHDTYHWISEVDEEARTATCSLCGPGVPILSAGTKRKVNGARMWRCRVAVLTEAEVKVSP